MPRGNDTLENSVASAAMRNQYGLHANADEMIRAERARIDPAVAKASLLPINEEATAELKKGGLKKAGSKFDLAEGEEVEDLAVRGNAIVAVISNEHGITRKAVAGANDDWKTPELSPDQVAAKAAAERDAHIAAETARLRAEADERIRQAEDEENQRVAEELEKIRENADKKLEKAQAEADKKTTKDDKPS